MYFNGFFLFRNTTIFFQCTKIYETMENVGIALFNKILLAAIIIMRLSIVKILCGDESLM